jgi:arylsulfatase A-like enzyme
MIPGRITFDVRGRFRSVVSGDWKLIWTPGQTGPREYQLYDIANDPDEIHDLSREFPERVRALAAEITAWMARAPGAQTAGAPAIPESDRDALEALGYIEE